MDIGGLLNKVRGILDNIVPFLIGLAVFVIIWGIIQYVFHANEEEKRVEARMYIVWGIVGVFFMLSIWGFVNILVNTFSLNNQIDSGKIPRVPAIPSGGNGNFSGGSSNGGFSGSNSFNRSGDLYTDEDGDGFDDETDERIP